VHGGGQVTITDARGSKWTKNFSPNASLGALRLLQRK